jgi:hypothetical protein
MTRKQLTLLGMCLILTMMIGRLWAQTGPVGRLPQALVVIDDFETDMPVYRHSTRDKDLQYTLTKPTGYAKQGTYSQLIQLPATGNQGRHTLTMSWKLPDHVVSESDGIMFWLQPQSDDTISITARVYENNGVRYRQQVKIEPRKTGQWQLIQLPIQSWRWDWEGSKDANNHFDPQQASTLSLEIYSKDDTDVVLALDAVSTFKQLPTYVGPKVSVRLADHKPGENHHLFVQLQNIESTLTKAMLHLSITDINGKAIYEHVEPVDVKFAKKPIELWLKNEGPDYFDLNARITVNEKIVYKARQSMGCIAPMDPLDAGPNPDSIFGIWVGGGHQAIGAKWNRRYVRGSDVNLVDGQYQFRNGPLGQIALQSDPSLSETLYFSKMPDWLTSQPQRSDKHKWPPKDWEAYGQFVRAVARGARKAGINHMEVWNEPVQYAYWMGDMASVVKLHEVTYKAIKAEHPDCVVLGPCPYTFLWGFFENFFKQGGGQWIDQVVTHAYGGRPDDDFVGKIQKLRQLMKQYGLGDRDIYITEMGYPTPRYTELQQARYMLQSYVYAMSQNVKLLVWHMLWDYSNSSDPEYAIQWHDRSPRPAYITYAAMTRMLENAKYVGVVSGMNEHQRGFQFTRRKQTIYVFWQTEGLPQATSLNLPITDHQVQVFDLLGGMLTDRVIDQQGKLVLSLNSSPIYLVVENKEK